MSSSDRTAFLRALSDTPYGNFLGVEPIFLGDELTLKLPFKDGNIGNPVTPALHGGAIGGFMELCAIAQVILEHPDEGRPIPIGVNFYYLRPAKSEDTFAKATITKHGRRIVNVQVTAWQGDQDNPIATLQGHFLIREKKS